MASESDMSPSATYWLTRLKTGILESIALFKEDGDNNIYITGCMRIKLNDACKKYLELDQG